ncbi:MAG: class I SAM-dependent methyltransferase [Chloroflexota bacterium]
MSDYSKACYLCDRTGLERLPKFPWLVKCSACGLVYNPALSFDAKDVSQQFYDELNMAHRKKIQSVLLSTSRSRWKWLHGQLSVDPGTLLEIGCGTGEFLVMAQRDGWKVEGLELSDSFRLAAKDWYGLSLKNKELEQANIAPDSFNAVVLLHVFEHLPNPLEFLAQASRVLKQEGWLFIIVPNLASWTDDLFGKSNPTLIKKDHFFHYNCSTLRETISKSDFEVVELTTYEPPHHIWTSLYWYLSMRRKASRRQGLQGKPGGSPSLLGWFRSNLPYWAGTLASLFLWPLRFGLQKNNRGHEIYLLCRRRR